MTKEKAELILAKLKGYERLERKATDETGWIAFMFSVERDEAEKMIRQARLKEPTYAYPVSAHAEESEEER